MTEPSVLLPNVGQRLAVLYDGSSVSIVGDQGAVRIRFEVEGSTGRLVSTGWGGEAVVAEGSIADVMDMFVSLRDQARPRRRFGASVAAAAVAAVALLGTGFFATTRSWSPPPFDAAAFQNALQASGSARLGAPSPAKLEYAPKVGARSVPIPPDLPSLDDPPPARLAPPAMAADKSPPPQPAKQPEPELPVLTRPVGTSATSTPEVESPAVAAAPRAVDEKRPEADGARKSSGPEAIMAAIGRMNPIEAAQAVKALDQIKTSLADTGEIPPEVLREIPHEIAKVLRDAGVGLTPGERREAGRKVSAVVRLPEAAIEWSRGRDGIASIPDSNSWVLTDGNVRLPLPGGGDIRTVDNMKEFGLQP